MLHLRGPGYLGVFVLLAVSLVGPSTMLAAEVYTVSGIGVDERAADEVSAKSVGLAKAQRDAMRALLERLTLRSDRELLPQITDAMVARAVRDFAVSEEKFGGGRYLAALDVRFKPEAVRKLLGGAGISFAEVASRPMLVLPVLQNAGSTLLWDEPNPWFDAWIHRDPTVGLVPLVLPLRDLSDLSEISAEQALAGDRQSLRSISQKYKAFGVLVVLGRLSVDPVSNAPLLDATMVRHQPGEPEDSQARRFQGRPGSDIEGLMDWTVQELMIGLEEIWKTENLQQSGSEQRIRVLVPVTRLADWLSVKRKIASVPSVRKVDVERLSVREARVDLTFLGEPNQLRRALALKDLDMAFEVEKGGWVVRPKSDE